MNVPYIKIKIKKHPNAKLSKTQTRFILLCSKICKKGFHLNELNQFQGITILLLTPLLLLYIQFFNIRYHIHSWIIILIQTYEYTVHS
jgi:hypothetical protein